MLRHFVFIRYTKGTSDAHIDEFLRLTRALPASIPTMRDLEVGRDVLNGARSWDVMLAMRFSSLDELREYQAHPAHQALMAFNNPQVADVGSVDFLETWNAAVSGEKDATTLCATHSAMSRTAV